MTLVLVNEAATYCNLTTPEPEPSMVGLIGFGGGEEQVRDAKSMVMGLFGRLGIKFGLVARGIDDIIQPASPT